MKNITLFKTKSNAMYCHSASVNQFLLVHPALNHLLTVHKQGIDVKEYLDNLIEDSLEIDDLGTFSKKELDYYFEKYVLLLESGYLDTIDTGKSVSGRLSAYTIKSNLANTRQITFEVTDSCNLKCEYCGYGKFYNDYDQRVGRNLSFKRAKNILDYLLDLFNSPLNKSQGRKVHIAFYGGEPLMNVPFLEKIVDYIASLRSQKTQFSFGMTTNAVLLGKYMDFLVKNDFDLLISLDGNEINNGYRVFPNGSSSFSIIYNNIKALQEKYPDYFDKRVNFNSVLHSKNSVSEIHEFIKREFNKIASISEINTGSVDPAMKEEFKKTYRNFRENISQLEDYSMIEKDMLISFPDAKDTTSTLFQYSGFISWKYDNLLFTNENEQFIPTGTCLPFSKKVFVMTNGKILPCERIGHQFDLAYVDEEKVDIDFEKIAEQYNRYYDKIGKQCSSCNITENCKQCLFYLDIEKEKPVCRGCMSGSEFSDYLSARMSYLEQNPHLYDIIMKRMFVL